MPKTSISLIIIAVLCFIGGLGYSLYSKIDGNSSTVKSAVSNPEQVMQAINQEQKKSVEATAKTSTSDKDVSPEKITKTNKEKIMNATLHTNKGDITIEFFGDLTPNTVANFVKLAKTGFYDGVKFHRVIKGFMIQGGDPLSKDDAQMARWGTGGPGYKFEDEITPQNHNDDGTIAMANSGPNTNGSQFFINAQANNFLDGKHTVFGKVTKGMDVVKAIETTPVDGNDRPKEAVIIKNISF